MTWSWKKGKLASAQGPNGEIADEVTNVKIALEHKLINLHYVISVAVLRKTVSYFVRNEADYNVNSILLEESLR